MAGYFEIVAEALDPEAFSEEGRAWSADPAKYDRMVELQDRRDTVSKKLTEGFGKAACAGYMITHAVGEYQGQHYWIEKGLSLSSKKLGDFVAAVLRHGGNVVGLHASNAAYANCDVQASVRIPDKQKEAFEAATGLKLVIPRGMVPA